jgi:hypothetical protein
MRALARPKPPVDPAGFRKLPLLEAKILAESGKTKEIVEFLEKGAVIGSEKIPDELQVGLAKRLSDKSYWGMAVRLFSPLSLPAIGVALYKFFEPDPSAGVYVPGGIFMGVILAAAFIGSGLANRFERRMAKLSARIIESGNVGSEPALEMLGYVIRIAKDAETSGSLLMGGPRCHALESELVLAIFESGSAAQAKLIRESGKVQSEHALHLLETRYSHLYEKDP